MRLVRVRLDSAAVRPLLDGLAVEYETRYGQNNELASTPATDFEPPGGALFVLVDGETTAAGGGFRRIDGETCEVKRMWTHPSYRRQGLAARVLAALEDAAKAAGYRRLVLETGPRQPEAVCLYEKKGYRRIPPFGPYEHALAFETTL